MLFLYVFGRRDGVAGSADVTAHQELCQLAITLAQCIENPPVLGQGAIGASVAVGKLVSVQTHQLVVVDTQRAVEQCVAARAGNAKMKIEITLLAKILAALAAFDFGSVPVQQPLQLTDLLITHAFGGKSRRLPLKRFAKLIQLEQLRRGQRDDASPGVRRCNDQASGFQAAQGIAQRAARGAKAPGQIRLFQFDSRGQIAFDDRGGQVRKNTVCQCRRTGNDFVYVRSHIVNKKGFQECNGARIFARELNIVNNFA